MKIRQTVALSPGKIIADTAAALRLQEDHVSRHVSIAGGTGKGKSKLLDLIMRQFMTQDQGFTCCDPHGDLIDATVEYAAVNNIDPSRIIHWKPSMKHNVACDPYADLPQNVSPAEFESCLAARVNRIIDAFLRNIPSADQEAMKRLRRWLSTFLFTCGTRVGGHHLGLGTPLYILTDPGHEHFQSIMDAVGPSLPSLFRRNFEKLQATKNARQQELWVESAINCIFSVLGVSKVIGSVFGQHAQSLNFKDIILSRKILLLDLRRSNDMSREQANILGGLVLNFLLDAAERIAEERDEADRVPHYAIVDEAENFLGEDLRRGFSELRKMRLSLILAFQNLSSLRKGDLDLVSRVVGQCGLQITFQQQDPEDIEYLGKAFGYGFLNLTPLTAHEVLPDGYDQVITRGIAIGAGTSEATSHSESISRGESTTAGWQTAESIQEQVSEALAHSHTEGYSQTRTRGRTIGRSNSISDSVSNAASDSTSRSEGRGVVEGRSATENRSTTSIPVSHGVREHLTKSQGVTRSNSESHFASRGASTSRSSGEQHGRSTSQSNQVTDSSAIGQSDSDTEGQTTTTGHGTSLTHGDSGSETQSLAETTTEGFTKGKSKSITFSFNQTPLARHKINVRLTGGLVTSVQDQLAAVMKCLASLADRITLVKCKGLDAPFLLEVHPVLDPHEEHNSVRSTAWKRAEVAAYLDRIRAAHPHYFNPDSVDHEAALNQFLSGAASGNWAPTNAPVRPSASSGATRKGSNGNSGATSPKKMPFQD